MSTPASSSTVIYSMTLSNELWLSIFEYLPSQSLRNVVLTSKSFHVIAIRLLYKHLILTSPTLFVAACSALSSIQPLPRALLLGISPLVERPVEQLKEAISLAEADDWTPIPLNRQTNWYCFFQIKDAYQPRFLADTTLVFRVVHCTVHFAGIYIDVDHTSLKLQSLTLLDICAVFPSNDDDTNPRNPRTRLRMLAQVPTIRTLTYDHTVWLYRVFTSSSPPPQLTTLNVKFPIHKYCSRVPPGFISFLETLPSLHTLILRNHVPTLSLSPSALPTLCAISAPLSAISSICSGRSIIKLDIRDEAMLTPLYQAFIEVHSHLSRVQELSLFVGEWDDEVVLAIVVHFPNLTKLQVRYARGGPSEDTILGMGSRTLYTLPHLISAHIFHIPLLPPPQSVLEARKRDDDTLCGAPGINNTLMEGVLSLQQLPSLP
ncbi:uncharacterized protein EDB93DRAFT_1308726 [Suillus bovinus]|uniref:uncharacterized protein n=1 Tax=Suillus bovinus TaxID=48563 RepID=UPI001B86041F|nr:uncharacterized protein EDB93DRAFT_1308726 [Suillus bovinus]KAG2133202.1 hypothetical protein EDB93DRAFT_1308726 [Suillus bovinus]